MVLTTAYWAVPRGPIQEPHSELPISAGSAEGLAFGDCCRPYTMNVITRASFLQPKLNLLDVLVAGVVVSIPAFAPPCARRNANGAGPSGSPGLLSTGYLKAGRTSDTRCPPSDPAFTVRPDPKV